MNDYEKLQDIVNEIDVLITHRVTKSTPAFQAWYTSAERFLAKKYGTDSIEYENFKGTKFIPAWYFEEPESIAKCRDGLSATKLTFQSYLCELEEDEVAAAEIPVNACFDKVFIVHGHDGELKEAVARIIEKQGIEAIILVL